MLKGSQVFFSRIGGKGRLAKTIVDYMPLNYKNLHYIELFCGGATVLFRKQKSLLETVNDTDKGLVNFWRVFQDEKLKHGLFKKCKSYIHFQDEWYRCYDYCRNNPIEKDRVEHAYCYWVKMQGSFCNVGDSFGFVRGGGGTRKRPS